LAQALPRGKLFESIIQKATELGAAEVVPLLSERVTVHLEQKDGAHKRDKWQAIAVEAIKQCGAGWLPRVHVPLAPKQFLEQNKEFEFAIVGSLQANARHPREVCDVFLRKLGRVPRSTCVWIGPEGDFTPAELDLIQAAGVFPVTLGPLVLRTETAAIYCLSILNYEFSCKPRD
jgi:16S rRNA (uracil1498-N3)-methyltransferase